VSSTVILFLTGDASTSFRVKLPDTSKITAFPGARATVRRYDAAVPVIRIREAANLLGVSDDTVRRWINDGSLIATRDESGRCLAFRVNTNRTIWSYELEPNGEGTRVIESRHAENGVSAFSTLSVNALFGGTASFERELLQGMNTSLANIKAAAEKG
jgi:excisionase family DNA binding protein